MKSMALIHSTNQITAHVAAHTSNERFMSLLFYWPVTPAAAWSRRKLQITRSRPRFLGAGDLFLGSGRVFRASSYLTLGPTCFPCLFFLSFLHHLVHLSFLSPHIRRARNEAAGVKRHQRFIYFHLHVTPSGRLPARRLQRGLLVDEENFSPKKKKIKVTVSTANTDSQEVGNGSERRPVQEKCFGGR